MTIEDKSAPQDANFRPEEGDLETRVRGFLYDLARAAEAEKKIAVGRANELAERVALLEGRGGTALADTQFESPIYDFAQKKDPSARYSFTQADSEQGRLVTVARDSDDAIAEEGLAGRMQLVERRLDDYEDDSKEILQDSSMPLLESTFSLLITQHPLSVPFAFGLFSVVLSISCLSLTLASSIGKGEKGNPLGIPAGVGDTVRAAQFLGLLVGILLEGEIPQGLQLIANGAGHTLLLNGHVAVQKKVIITSVLRLIVGYLFLSSLFLNVVQNDNVIEIFYDVLALEFVEHIDDAAFALAKKGFFGRGMLIATNQEHTVKLKLSEMQRSISVGEDRGSALERMLSVSGLISSGLIASRNRVNLIVRFMYFLNAVIIVAGLVSIHVATRNGQFICRSINVLFDEEVWENAIVVRPGERTMERLLIYSSFNGVYKEDGTHEGYPKYIEQNKNNGTPFGPSVTGAEIIYCTEICSWVLRHPSILTSRGEENECSWLWRSPQTKDYNLLSATEGAWEVWIGEVKPLSQVSISCNECSETHDCNYRGACEEKVCICDDLHFGDSCEFAKPCESLATEKAHIEVNGLQEWDQEKPIRLIANWTQHRIYNRPVYIQRNLTGQPYDMRLYKILEKQTTSMPPSITSHVPSMSNGPALFPFQSPTTRPPTLSPSYQPSSLPSSIPSDLPTLMPATKPTLTLKPSTNPSPPTYNTNFPFNDGIFDNPFNDGPTETPRPSTAPYSSTVSIASYVEPYDDTSEPTLSPSLTQSARKSPLPNQPPPTQLLHSENEYDNAPDFADWDDFFESVGLHNDLADVLEDYSVIISYSGSRFYGTIFRTGATFESLFPQDHHAFWSNSFDVNRTFIISGTTLSSNPIGVDFFEMRRRIEKYEYGPFGALIPLMNYQGTGFFHCLRETSSPDNPPSISGAPTTSSHPSKVPSEIPS